MSNICDTKKCFVHLLGTLKLNTMAIITKAMTDAIKRHDLSTLKGRKACLNELKALGLSHQESIQLINENL